MNLLLLDPNDPAPARGALTIEPLGPLSLVTDAPGAYYFSAHAPSDPMLMGMLENALGLHYGQELRTFIFKRLKVNPKQLQESNSGFRSVLQPFLRVLDWKVPPYRKFHDYWNRLSKDTLYQFPSLCTAGGYDERLISLVEATPKGVERLVFNRAKNGIQKVEDILAAAKDPENDGAKKPARYDGIEELVARFYKAPTRREYVLFEGPLQCTLQGPQALLLGIQSALTNPASPLFLGHSEGWVEASLQLP